MAEVAKKREEAVHAEGLPRLSKRIASVITRLPADGPKGRVSIPDILTVGEAVELAVPGRATSLAGVGRMRGNKAGLLFVGSETLLHP